MTAILPAHLSETINNLGDAAKALADEVRADRMAREADLAEERAQRRRESRRVTLLLTVIGVLVLLVAIVSVYTRIAGQQSRRIVETIESCTTVDGDCAKEGQKRTAAAVEKLIRVNVEIGSCARTHRTDADYRSCVDRAIADLNRPTPLPAPSVTD